MKQTKATFILFIFILIFMLIVYIGRFTKNYRNKLSLNEYFGNWTSNNNFSPYNNSEQRKAKTQDYILLDNRIKNYELSNSCDQGYTKLGWPPSNPLYNYPILSFHPFIK